MVDFKTIGLNEPFYITVKNWEKYQGKNIGRRFWIKLDVMLFDDCLVASLTPVTFKCYIGALLLAGKCGTSEVRVTIKSWSSEVQVRASDLRVSASSLQENQLVTAQTARQEKNREEQRRTEKNREEKNRTEKKQTKKNAASEPPRAHWLSELWNDHCGDLPKIKLPVSSTRSKKIMRAVKDLPGAEDWRRAIIAASESDFCNGKGGKGWVATFDWLLKPDSAHKLLEGQYANKNSSTESYWDKQRKRLEEKYQQSHQGEKIINPQKEV